MSLFGPFYPRPLQAAVNHAERLARAVAMESIDRPPVCLAPGEARSEEDRWLLGRAEEIEVLVGDVVADWRAGMASARGAAATIQGYLDDVHAGFVALRRAPPPCCRPSSTTVAAEVTYGRAARGP